MMPRRKGGIRLGIKFGGLLLLSLAVLFALGGCAWIREWLNPNHAPVAIIRATPTSGEAPLEVIFDASESYDPDGDEIVSYEWNFGVEVTACQGTLATVLYETPGVYDVCLTVTDSDGLKTTASATINVIEIIDGQTNNLGILEVQSGEVSYQVRVTDQAGYPVPNVLCTLVTNQVQTLILASDPSERYLPQLASLWDSQSVSWQLHPSFVLFYFDLRMFEYETQKGSVVESEEYLPEGLTVDYVNKHYRLEREASLKEIREEYLDQLLLDLAAEDLQQYIVALLAMFAEEASGVLAVALFADSAINYLELRAADKFYKYYKEKGYSDNDMFKLLVPKYDSPRLPWQIIIIPVEQPHSIGASIPSTSHIYAPEDVVLPPSAAETEQEVMFEYEVQLAGANRYFVATINPGNNVYVKDFTAFGASSGRYVGELKYMAPKIGETQVFEIQGQMCPTPEGQTNDDSETVTFKVTTAIPPDLVVNSLALSGSSAQVGDTVSVTFTVKDQGPPIMQEFKASVFLSNRQYLGGRDILLKEVPMVLDGDKDKTETVEVTIPQVPPGDWYLAVYVDAGEDVEESNENNNIDSVPITITASQPSQVTLTLYVHEDNEDGPPIVGARVQGHDGARSPFDKTTNQSGYVTITGAPGTWHLVVSKDDYQEKSWDWEVTQDETRSIFLERAQQENQPPVIESLVADPPTVEPGGQSRISVSAYDPDGDPLSYTWSATGGRLSSTTGPRDKTWTAPNTPGTYQVTVSVADNKPGHSPVSRSVDLTAVARLTITTVSLPAGQVRQSYRATLEAAGGTPPYRWSIKAGSLPSGLSLDPTTGVISGAPAGSGTFHFTVQVRDSTSQTIEKDFSISIASSVTKPHVSTDSATDIGETSATLKGFLDSTGGEECQVWFEYGVTTSYGHSTPKQTLNTAGPFSAHISGLKPNTPYHFKACASNSRGTSCGEDATFRTKAKIDQLPQIMRPQENEVFQAEVGKVFTLQIEAQDPEGQKLVYMLTEGPSSLTLDRDTGLIQWTPASVFAGKKVKVTFYVSDRPIGQTAGREVYRTFYIEVQGGADNTPPTVVETNPADGDLGAPITDTITVTFSEEVRRGTGSVTIIDESKNQVAIQGISVSGCVLTIRLANQLAYSTAYAVGIGTGVVADLAGNPNPEYSWKFRTRVPQAPPSPSLVAPPNGANDVSTAPTLQWNPVSGAEGYAVQVATDTGFSVKVFDQVVLSTSVQVSPALDAGTRYFWRVAAMGEGGISSWSDVWSFTTESTPQTGHLWVESSPGEAKVYVDGQYKGNTPATGYLKIENLAAGDHTLKVTKSSYKDWVGTVTVPAGSTTYKAVILEPITVNAEIFNPTVNSSQIQLGGQITLSCTVKNTGNVAWTFYVALTLRKPNGIQVNHPDLKPLNLNPGQQGSVFWSYTPDMAGSWDVIFGVWREANQQEAIVNSGWLNDFFTVTEGTTELITNGSFSEGAKGWNVYGEFWVGTGLPNYRTSPGYAAGGVDASGRPINNAVGGMYQAVTIPSDISSTTLTFWYNITSEETATVSHDVLNVTIQDSSGHHLATVAILSNVDKSSLGNYRQIRFDLTPYKGRTIRINFSATTNDSKHTVFRIDDVSLVVN